MVESYNTLPDDADQPHVAEAFITGLKNLIKEYNVQNKFGFHLVHGHVKMAKDRVMFGRPMNSLPGLWTRPTKVDQLDLGGLHGHVFVLGANSEFHPYEFRQGPPPALNANDNAFIVAAQKYLELNGLAGVLGIQLLDQDTPGKHMKEFVLSDTDGTVMLPENAVNPTETYRVTGWNAVEGIIDVNGGESHAKTVKGTHQVFTGGKGLPDVGGEIDAEEIIVEGLREAGIVN